MSICPITVTYSETFKVTQETSQCCLYGINLCISCDLITCNKDDDDVDDDDDDRLN